MAAYMIDAVALLRYLVDELPAGANEVFDRAERGIDILRAPDVQVAEALYQVSNVGVVAGIELQGPSRHASTARHERPGRGRLDRQARVGGVRE